MLRERGLRGAVADGSPDRAQMQEIARLMSLGLLKVHVDQVLDFSQAAQAHALVATMQSRQDRTGSLTRR